MNGVHEYIKSIVPNPVYSEMFACEFTDNGAGIGVKTINIEYRERGAKCILVHWLILSTVDTSGGGFVYTVKDNFNRLLMKFTGLPSMNGMYDINHVIRASSILLTFVTDANPATFLTAHYQYIYDAESKVLKP